MTEQLIYVYQTICEANGKSYVGVHKTDNINDGYIGCGIRNHSSANRKNIFHNAVRKYGYTSFRRYILSFYDTYEEALAEEKFIVNEEWIKSKKNYNCAIGGKGSPVMWMSDETKKLLYLKVAESHTGAKRSKETRDNMSKAQLGKKLSESHKLSLKNNNARYWLGKNRSEETKLKLANSRKGKKLSIEHKEKLSNVRMGRPSNNRKAVLKYNLFGKFICEYASITEAAQSIDRVRGSIHNNLINGQRNCCGFYFKYKEE